jgi:bacterioferritin-associated ferredoxin
MCRNVTDAGIRKVINHCNQLRVLDLTGLSITGMCTLCENPEPKLCLEIYGV